MRLSLVCSLALICSYSSLVDGCSGQRICILIVKQLFGGLGQNFMNPALGARCFLLLSFTGPMTSFVYDGVTGPTPLSYVKSGALDQVNTMDMLIGTIPGTIVFGILNAKIGKVYIDCGGVTDCADHIPAHDDTRQLSGMAGVQADYRRYPGGVFGCAMPLVTELFPQKYRGKLAAVLTSLFSLAMIFGGQLYSFMGDSNWQVLMYTAIIPPAVGQS